MALWMLLIVGSATAALAGSPAETTTILEAISKQDLSCKDSDSLSFFTMGPSGEEGTWILQHSDSKGTVTGHLEELGRFPIRVGALPERPGRKTAFQFDVIDQYVLVGSLGKSENSRGIHVWGLVQEIATKPRKSTAIFIPIGSASNPSIALEEAGVLANVDFRERAAAIREPSQKLEGICDENCVDILNQCGDVNVQGLEACIRDCPPPIGAIGGVAFIVCAELCGAQFYIGSASCFASYLTCLVLQTGCPASPILLDLDNNNFHLVGLEDAVSFDIDADGETEVTAWTRWDQGDVFLCLDRNGNGWIEDGTELFGNYTPLLFGATAPNGYVALAEFDMEHLGGTDDGFIDEKDAIYSDLCVWHDANNNGYSEAEEISDLASNGIERIDLNYSASRKADQHGNEFRYWSDAWIREGNRLKRTPTVDVFFVTIPW